MDHTAFGARLYAARKAKGLTQRALGDAVGTTSQTISNYEVGKGVDPGGALLVRLASVLGVSLDYLVGTDASTRERPPTAEDVPTEQAEDIAWAADAVGLDALERARLAAVRRSIGPMSRAELLTAAELIAKSRPPIVSEPERQTGVRRVRR
jgi:transcriptional regulator with XRE-family HTH domain